MKNQIKFLVLKTEEDSGKFHYTQRVFLFSPIKLIAERKLECATSSKINLFYEKFNLVLKKICKQKLQEAKCAKCFISLSSVTSKFPLCSASWLVDMFQWDEFVKIVAKLRTLWSYKHLSLIIVTTSFIIAPTQIATSSTNFIVLIKNSLGKLKGETRIYLS